jgi:hypothetical protein
MESWMTVYNWPVFRCPQLAGFEVSPEAKSAAGNRQHCISVIRIANSLRAYYRVRARN